MKNDFATKSKIADTFNKKSLQKDVDKITVKELVEACKISRQTFYYHFKDIFDVILWNFNSSLEKIRADCPKTDNLREVIQIFFNDNLVAREVAFKILNSSFGARCRENYFRTVRAELFNILKKEFGDSAIKISDLEFATDFYAHALTGLILSYYENLSLEKKFLSDKINRLICGGVEKISA